MLSTFIQLIRAHLSIGCLRVGQAGFSFILNASESTPMILLSVVRSISFNAIRFSLYFQGDGAGPWIVKDDGKEETTWVVRDEYKVDSDDVSE